jgi:hypothetical protein
MRERELEFEMQGLEEHLEETVYQRALESNPEDAVRIFGIDEYEDVTDNDAARHNRGAIDALIRNADDRLYKRRKPGFFIGGIINVVESNNLRASRQGLPATLTVDQWRACLAAYDDCCAYCGARASNIVHEHMIPIIHGGGTELKNVVPACSACNSLKRRKELEPWLQSRGLLASFLERKQKADGLLGLERPSA